MKTIQILAMAMLIGSLPFGYISLNLKKIKPTTETGELKIYSQALLGKSEYMGVLFLDICKGFIPVLISIYNSMPIYVTISTAVILIISDLFPYWLLFKKAGKGWTVAIGAVLGLIVKFII